ncbi:Endonuclease/exonuclease/phosphatase [Corchorus olitorius]|uniref:Endonuclease/exonuclease/phosphatase n=1 Tax=Corchorus olitorius TaxID=93759 RepID=A0A1R3KJW1_9ROSI|nr:Endonuclease/exonuclease/phosphatase [Corchorus olitorius]
MEVNSLENPDLRDEAIRRDKKKYKKRRDEASPEAVGESSVPKQAEDDGVSTSSISLDTSRISYKDCLAGVPPTQDSSWEEWIPGDDEEDVSFDDSVSDPEEESKRAVVNSFKNSIRDVKSAGRREWNPKKEGRIKIVSNSRVRPPPGFSFKAGSSKPIIFDPKRLENLVGEQSTNNLPLEIISAEVVNSQVVTVVEQSGGDGMKTSTSNLLFLPQQQPPSKMGLVPHNSDSDMVVDDEINLSKDEPVEPRVSDAKADRIIRRLRFDGFTKVDVVGFFGGIWVLWKSSIGTVNVVEKSVYVSPTPSFRDFLWNYLHDFDEFDNIPWLLLGDFNQFLAADEKSSGKPEPIRRVEQFREILSITPYFHLRVALGDWNKDAFVNIYKKKRHLMCKGRRPVKENPGKSKSKADGEESGSQNRSNVMNGVGRNSRNCYNPLNGAPLDSGEKAKEPLSTGFKNSIRDAKSAGRREWNPKNEGGIKIVSNSRVGPPPGFSFKAGSSKPIIFYPKRLENLVGEQSTNNLPSEIISAEQPPSKLGLVLHNSDSDMVVDDDINLSKDEPVGVVEPSFYVSPTPSFLDFLWNYLHDFDEFDNIPWLLLGDFNQFLAADEKSGGKPEPIRRVEQFREVVDKGHLIDFEASGCKFTWSNKQPPGLLI